MNDEDEVYEDNAPARGVGSQLRAARERRGLTLDQVAAETRISRRHLELIEAGDFEDMPGRTYAVGFAKNYAKVVGLDQGDVADMVRAEMKLERKGVVHHGHNRSSFEPGDPARAPGGRLVWFSLAAVVLLMVGLFFAARVLFAPAAELPSLAEEEQAELAEQLAAQQATQQQAQEPVAVTGPVVFTAEDEVWARFYDAEGRVLREGTLAAGDTYTIPQDAEGPQILTGRPHLLAITVGGRPVPKLSDELETISDVPVSAQALVARGRAPSSASTAATPAARPASARATSAPAT